MHRIIPQPSSHSFRDGSFLLDESCHLIAEAGTDACAAALRTALGMSLAAGSDSEAKHIRLRRSERAGGEGYLLRIDEQTVLLEGDEAGLFYAVQSLLQLLPMGMPCELPCCEIEDRPRFSWRGCLLDCSRHFRSVDFIKRFIDQLARYKLNRFHWHICDDQGWRLEIDAYPQLTEIGAWRTQADGSKHGGFYSKEEVRGIIAHAAERHFIGRIETIVEKLDKRLIGWDEILELDSEGIGHEVAVTYPKGPEEDRRRPGALVQSWRDPSGVRAALACGHDCIVSTEHSVYLNYPNRRLPLERVYHFDPAFGEFGDDARLLGMEAALWGERLTSDDVAERQLYPRLLAAAECAWSRPETKDWPDFRRALLRESKGLRARGFTTDPDCGLCDLRFDMPQAGGLLLRVENRADEPLFLEGHCESPPGIRFDESHVEATVAPRSSREIPLAMRCDADCEAASSTWQLRYANAIGPDICIDRSLNIRPEEELVCRAMPAELSTPVRIDDWPGFSQEIPGDHGTTIARFDCRHDDTHIHIASQVRGPVGDIDTTMAPWEQDSIEIRLDGREEIARFHSDGEFEFRDVFLAAMCPGDDMGGYACCYRSADLPQGSRASCYRNEQGYAAWVAVPIAWLCREQGENWSSLRCNVAINRWVDGKRRVFEWRPAWRSAGSIPWSGTFTRG